MMSFTFHAAFSAFAIAGTMFFTNAVKAKLFRGDDLSSFVDILNSAGSYCFVIFASAMDAFSCFLVLMSLHDICSLQCFSLNGLSGLSNLSMGWVSFSPFTYYFNQLIKSLVFPVVICSH